MSVYPAYQYHPAPWEVRRFGYERYALLDADGAEVAEFVQQADAEFCRDARNRLMTKPKPRRRIRRKTKLRA